MDIEVPILLWHSGRAAWNSGHYDPEFKRWIDVTLKEVRIVAT
jgi:hypothetical protein